MLHGLFSGCEILIIKWVQFNTYCWNPWCFCDARKLRLKWCHWKLLHFHHWIWKNIFFPCLWNSIQKFLQLHSFFYLPVLFLLEPKQNPPPKMIKYIMKLTEELTIKSKILTILIILMLKFSSDSGKTRDKTSYTFGMIRGKWQMTKIIMIITETRVIRFSKLWTTKFLFTEDFLLLIMRWFLKDLNIRIFKMIITKSGPNWLNIRLHILPYICKKNNIGIWYLYTFIMPHLRV